MDISGLKFSKIFKIVAPFDVRNIKEKNLRFHLNPTLGYSETKISQHPKMSKKGHSTLRAALYMASVTCIKHNKELKSLYLKKISQGKEAKQALVCVGKKLSCIMYSMLKNGTSKI